MFKPHDGRKGVPCSTESYLPRLGEDCTGDFGEPNETDSWYERFNFLPGPNGRYYGYVLPMGPHESPPNPTDRNGWLVIFVARRVKGGPLLPVGWYEDATFEDSYRERPEYTHGAAFPLDRGKWQYTYVLAADAGKVHRIPAESRVLYPEVPAQPSFLRNYFVRPRYRSPAPSAG